MTEEEYLEIFNNQEKYLCEDGLFDCPICHVKKSKKGFILHVKRQHLYSDNGKVWSSCSGEHYNTQEYKEKILIANRKNIDNKYGIVKDFEVFCNKCGKKFTVQEREKQHPKKEKYFCSLKCSHSHVLSDETKDKIRNGINKAYIDGIFNNGKIYHKVEKKEKQCPLCGKTFSTLKKYQECCSRKCSSKYKFVKRLNCCTDDIEKEKLKRRQYRTACKFKFGVKSYPEEFDFDLIRKYGWYKAVNNGNNINGVSRDHMFSVMDGYRNNIAPELIAHPANCRLIKHSENQSKCDDSIITLQELLDRINIWNEKYKDNK